MGKKKKRKDGGNVENTTLKVHNVEITTAEFIKAITKAQKEQKGGKGNVKY